MTPLPSVDGRAKVRSPEGDNEHHLNGRRRKLVEYGNVLFADGMYFVFRHISLSSIDKNFGQGRDTDIASIGETLYYGAKLVTHWESEPVEQGGRRPKRRKASSGDC